MEFLELYRLALEAITAQPVSTDEETYDPPLLLTQAVPSLFIGQELNPVAPGAQRKVPLPPGLDLSDFINPDLASLLASADHDPALTENYDPEDAAFHKFYHEKTKLSASTSSLSGFGNRTGAPASQAIDSAAANSYQSSPGPDVDPAVAAQRRRERRDRNRDDPFYIFTPGDVSDGEIDAIPIMELKLDENELATANNASGDRKPKARKPKERVEIAGDEMLEGADDFNTDDAGKATRGKQAAKSGKKKKRLLQVDSTALEGFSLDDDEEKEAERKEVERSKREVERLRREMEAAAKRVQDQKKQEESAKADAQEEGKKKKKKKDSTEVKKKKKTKKEDDEGAGGDEAAAEGKKTIKKKKKKQAENEGENEGDVAEGKEKKKTKKATKKKKGKEDGDSAEPATATAV